MFETDSPKAANLLKRSSYVDDLIDSQPSTPEALKIARETTDPPLIDSERFSDINQSLGLWPD